MRTQLDAPSVAFAWLYTAWGGAEIQLLHLARHAPEGTQITVIAPRATDETLRALWSAVAHRWIDVDHHIAVSEHVVSARGPARLHRLAQRLRRGADAVRAGFEFRRAVRSLPADAVVHVDIPPWSACCALAAVARTRPVVLCWHTPLPPATSRRAQLVTAKTRLLGRVRGFDVVAASEPARLDAARVFGRDRSDIMLLPAGYDPDEIEAVEPSEADEAVEASDLVVGVGAMVTRKGVDIAIEAVRRLHDRGRVVRLIWLGDGDQRATLEREVRRYGLGDLIELRPPDRSTTHRIDVLRTVARSAVYVQPSRVDGLPIAVLEAMALGRPVIATKIGAMSELDGGSGITWVPVDDPDALADALAALLDDPRQRHALGRHGRAFVEGRYDMRRAAPTAFDHDARLLATMQRRRRRRSAS